MEERGERREVREDWMKMEVDGEEERERRRGEVWRKKERRTGRWVERVEGVEGVVGGGEGGSGRQCAAVGGRVGGQCGGVCVWRRERVEREAERDDLGVREELLKIGVQHFS
jgi:hypothetical protein